MADELARLKAAYARWHDSKGTDAEPFYDLISDDFVLRVGADVATGPEFLSALKPGQSGRTLMEGYFATLLAGWEMQSYEAETVFGDGKQFAMFGTCSWRSKATGKTAATRIANLWRFRHGKAYEMIEIFDTATAMAAATHA